jgi:hypothetical protein
MEVKLTSAPTATADTSARRWWPEARLPSSPALREAAIAWEALRIGCYKPRVKTFVQEFEFVAVVFAIHGGHLSLLFSLVI